MKIIKTYIKDLTLIKSTTFSDNRGLFREVDKQNILKKNLFLIVFLIPKKILYEDFISKQKKVKQKL